MRGLILKWSQGAAAASFLTLALAFYALVAYAGVSVVAVILVSFGFEPLQDPIFPNEISEDGVFSLWLLSAVLWGPLVFRSALSYMAHDWKSRIEPDRP
jgi:hypothetical protein